MYSISCYGGSYMVKKSASWIPEVMIWVSALDGVTVVYSANVHICILILQCARADREG